MRARLILVCCGLATGCSGSYTGLAIEGAEGTGPDVTATCDGDGQRTSIEAPQASLACLGLICDATRVPGEAACNDPATNPFAGTCVANFFACYGAAGACTASGGDTELDFANGARLQTRQTNTNLSHLTGPGASEPCIVGGESYSNSTTVLLYFQL